MKRELPDWQPFELDEAGTLPLELSGMSGSTLVLLGLPGADDSGWAVRAAVVIARRRSERRRVLLADLDLARPRLHEELGVEPGEGMSDVLLYGASLPRVARRVDAGFLFVPSGTPVGLGGRALASSRFDALVAGFDRADAELFLYLPWTAAGRDRVLARARNAVILAERADVEGDDAPRLTGLRVGAVLGPAEDRSGDAGATDAAGPAARPSASPSVGGESLAATPGAGPLQAPAPVPVVAHVPTPGEESGPRVGADEAEAAALVARPPLAVERDPSEFDALFDDAERRAAAAPPVLLPPPRPASTGAADGWGGAVEDPVVAAIRIARANRRSRRGMLVLGILFLTGAAVVVAGLFGVLDVAGVPTLPVFRDPADARVAAAGGGDAPGADASTPASAPGPSTPASTSGPTTPESGSPSATASASEGGDPAADPGEASAAPVREAAVAVGSFRRLDVATEQAGLFAARSDQVAFFLAPVEVDGRGWFRLLAEPRSEVPADGLVDAVARALGGDGGRWFVRRTPLAFDLGGAATLDAAVARAAELARAGVPAHVLVLDPEGDAASPRYRVYGGGYASESEAAHMRALLREHGLGDAPLVPRVGRIPGPASSSSS